MNPITVPIIHITLEIWGSIFCLIAAFFTFLCRYYETKKKRIAMSMQASAAVLLIADALSWGFRGYPGKVGYYTVRIFNFMVFFISDILLVLYHQYVCNFIFEHEEEELENHRPLRFYLVNGLGVFGMIMVVISQYTDLYYYFDANNQYHRNTGFTISIIVAAAGALLDLSLLIQYRKKIKNSIFVSLISYIVLPVIAAAVLVFYYGFSLINISITISIIYMFLVGVVEQRNILQQKEKEMADMRIEVMLSQISPHFIYNTLTAIQYLCTNDPKLAEETVGEFAMYLRNTIDSLTNKRNIPFEKELDHVKNYLSIEKKRFGKLIHVQYDIKVTDFVIPTLTLQPFVENAVKYGIGKKEEGGTVLIKTEKKKDFYVITVVDNGIGFDVNQKKEDGRSHIGLRNAKTRLASMCNGTVNIQSVIGQGTTVTIKLPADSQ